MREWVVPFLRMKGDPNISTEELERELLVPTFCFRRLANCFTINFPENTRLVELFGSVISDLPFGIFSQLLLMRNLFFSYTKAYAEVQAFQFAEGTQGIFCWITEKLVELSDSAVRGAICHELGHIICDHYTVDAHASKTKEVMESEADSAAEGWGFAFEISIVRGKLKTESQI